MLRQIRGQILAWVGIVGGALTLASHWSNFLTLADWMQRDLAHWGTILQSFWASIGAIIGLPIAEDQARVLSLMVFLVLLLIGVHYQSKPKDYLIAQRYDNSSTIKDFFGFVLLPLAILILLFRIHYRLRDYEIYGDYPWLIATIFSSLIYIRAIVITSSVLYSVIACLISFLFIMGFDKNWNVLPNVANGPIHWILAFIPFYILVLGFGYAPIRPLIKHLSFLLIAVAIIFGLSEISKQVAYLRTVATTVETR
jgi:hypothetical protein